MMVLANHRHDFARLHNASAMTGFTISASHHLVLLEKSQPALSFIV